MSSSGPSRKHYSEEFKLAVIRDYLSSDMSIYKCVNKYGIGNRSSLSRWLAQYGYESKAVVAAREGRNGLDHATKETLLYEIAQLKKRVAELEQALEEARREVAK